MVSRPKWDSRWLSFLSVIVGFLLYIPALWSYFLSDDFVITSDAKGQSILGLFRGYDTSIWRPLQHLLARINLSFFAQQHLIYGAESLIAYLLGIYLVYRIAAKLTDARVAFVASLLFAVHFSHTEPVFWFAASNELWAFLFAGTAYLIHIGRGRGAPRLIMSIFCLAIAMLFKESAVIFPILFIIADIKNENILKKIVAGLPAMILSAVYLALRFPGIVSADSNYHITASVNILQNTTFYAMALIFPLDYFGFRHLAKTEGITTALLSGWWFVLFAFLSFIFVLFLLVRKKSFIPMLLSIVGFLPYLLLPGSGMRFLYVPSAFFAIAIAQILTDMGRWRVAATVIVVIVWAGASFVSGLSYISVSNIMKKTTAIVQKAGEMNIRHLYIVHPPDNIDGVYFLRNGGDRLGSLYTSNTETLVVQKFPETLGKGDAALIFTPNPKLVSVAGAFSPPR